MSKSTPYITEDKFTPDAETEIARKVRRSLSPRQETISENKALTLLVSEEWLRQGQRLVTKDMFLAEAFDAHYESLSAATRAAIGFRRHVINASGIRAEVDAVKAAGFFAERGQKLNVVGSLPSIEHKK